MGGGALPAAVLVVERVRALLDLAAAKGEDAQARAVVEQTDARLAGDEGAYRRRMYELFSLEPAEVDALDVAVAVAVEPSIGPSLAAMHGHSGTPLPSEIVLRLLFGHGPRPVVHGGSALVRWGLVERIDWVGGSLGVWRADPAVVDWYFGKLTAGSIPLSRLAEHSPLPEWRVAEHAERIAGIMAEKRPVRIAIHGGQGTGKASFARALAAALGKKALALDGRVLAQDGGPMVFQRLQRLALLGDLALVWRGDTGPWPANVPLAMLQFVTLDAEARLTRRDGLVDLSFSMPVLGEDTRASLYKQYLPELADTMSGLLGQPRLGDLVDAAAQKIDKPDDMRAFLRQRNAARTGNIGRIVASEFDWDDLVLDDMTTAALRSFADEARLRSRVLSSTERRRVFGNAAHLTVLFSGSPGLGKSMAAKVIARDLGLDLLVVDYASMASKYIGEMAKNMSAAFEVARDARCAMVIDEADMLFSSRTKVETSNDRHGNADIGHLLQLVEAHEGVVILSTNKRGNLDPALYRRLRYIVEFKKPQALERGRLWSRLLGLVCDDEALVAQLVPVLAETHELTPAQIKGAVLTAAYRAMAAERGIEAGDIAEGIRAEMRKDGRLVSQIASPPQAVRRQGMRREGNG